MAEFLRADKKFINIDNIEYIDQDGENQVKVFMVGREHSLKLSVSETAELMKNLEFKDLSS